MIPLDTLFPDGYADAHHHIWAPETRGDAIGYGWLRDIGAPKPFGDPTPIQRDYLMQEFLSEAAPPPRASVHVQTDGGLPDPVTETAFVQAQADARAHPVAIVGLADLSAPDLADCLARHGAHAGFRGVRQIVARLEHRPDLSFAPRDFLADPQWIEGLKRVQDAGLSFDLQLYPEQAEQAAEILAHTPALTVIIDHALSPHDDSAAGQARWRKAVRLMAERPGTLIKLSGFGMYQPDWITSGAFDTHIAEVLRAFGPERVLWGSNYPVEKLASRYEACLRRVAHEVPADARLMVFLETITKAYKLTLT